MDVHASVRRAQASHLLHGPRLKNRPNFSASAGLSTFFRLNGEGSPVGSQRRMPRSRFAAFSRKGGILFPSGRTRRASDGASRLSRCIRRPPSRPWVTHPFTSIWPSPMPCGTAAPVNEKLPRQSCAVGYEKPVDDSNREQLITAARLLRPLLGELVFVGGTVTGLLITDEAAG
jgi:hypothetical protein